MAITGATPAASAICTALNPTGPNPSTARLSPGRTPLSCTAW